MSWIEKVKENMLPLSINQNVTEAIKEWVYTGDCYDLGSGRDTCQLCDHPNIRYQFVIVNKTTENILLIGSECITKFGIAAIDEDGNMLSDEETLKKVKHDRSRLISDAKEKRMLNSLVHLSQVDEEIDIEDFIKYYNKRGAFSPKQLSLLFWRFRSAKIPYDRRDFKMTIRKDKEKTDLLGMAQWKYEIIKPAMTSAQIKWYKEHSK